MMLTKNCPKMNVQCREMNEHSFLFRLTNPSTFSTSLNSSNTSKRMEMTKGQTLCFLR